MTKLIVAFLGLLALASCGRGGDDDRTLHVGSQRGSTKAIMLASGALEGAPYKVEWAEFPAAQPLLEAIGGGSVDLGLVGDAPFMFAYQSGSPIAAVGAQYVPARPRQALAVLVPRNSRVKSIADLKGKSIATSRGSVGHYLVIRALAASNLPPDYVRMIFLAPGDAKAAFTSGAVDAWATWAPYLYPSIKEGARVVADGHDLVRGYGFTVANRSAIDKHRGDIADFLKREAKALRWAQTNRAAYAQVLAKETGLPIDVADDFAAKNQRQSVPIDDTVIADQKQVLDDFRRAGAFDGRRDVAAAFDRSVAGTSIAAN